MRAEGRKSAPTAVGMNSADEIKHLFSDNDKTKKIFKEIKKKMNNLCKSYLNRFILDDIYNYFINDIIPLKSFQIFNEKIKNIFKSHGIPGNINNKNEKI